MDTTTAAVLACTHLDRISSSLNLDANALGRLLHADSQHIESWRTTGIPASKQPAIDDILALISLLEKKLHPGLLTALAKENTHRGTLIEQIEHDPSTARAAYEEALNPGISA